MNKKTSIVGRNTINTSHSVSTDSPIQLIHISDTHLFADPDARFFGVPCARSFEAVLNAIEQQLSEQEINTGTLVVTGDISQDETFQSYQYFFNRLTAFEQKTAIKSYVQSGNHDDIDLLEKALSESALNQHNQNAVQIVKQLQLSREWQLIFINTQVSDEIHGYLTGESLFELEQLLEKSLCYTLIFCHHNVLDINCQWLNKHKLQNSEQLWEIIEKYPCVKGVAHGHIHQEVDLVYRSIAQPVRVLSTPATSIQFKPNSVEFQLDQLAQGWRLIELYPDGQIGTTVYRLPKTLFPIDLSGAGY